MKAVAGFDLTAGRCYDTSYGASGPILLGVVHLRYLMVVGFLLFTLLDGVAGAFHLSLEIGEISMWWVELAFLPMALISIPILRWCYVNWRPHHLNGGGTPMGSV